MTIMSRIEKRMKAAVPRETRAYDALRTMRQGLDRATHSVADLAPEVIRANTKRVFVSLVGNCNLKCGACHYGREFMPGRQLPWSLGEPLIADCAAAGIRSIRLYGGEPLLHRDIERYVAAVAATDMQMYVTTNGLLLGKKVERLHDAGLRRVSLGMYGVGEAYDRYAQTAGAFEIVERSIARTRSLYGPDEMRMHLDWLLMRPTCDVDVVRDTLEMCDRYQMALYVNLIHYSLPYFLKDDGAGGGEAGFHFRPEDRPRIERVIDYLLERKAARPDLIRNTSASLRSIPDWLMLGPQMQVPCTERELVWVGPDGTVQMCYVTFEMGNLNRTRLRDLLFTSEHHRFARAAYELDCPNCHCSFETRIDRHGPSRRKYGG